MKWTVGLTTCPRSQGYYLATTLDSLARAGWIDVTIYAEPGSVIPDTFKGNIILRRKQYGDWTNWASGLYDLLLSQPDTDYFFMAEDDFVVCQQAKEYLEQALPLLPEFASLSLYTPSIYSRKRIGFYNECGDDVNKRAWSTVTVIMSNKMARKFFSDRDVQQHRFQDMDDVLHNPGVRHASYGRGNTSVLDMVGNTIKDVVIARWAYKLGLPVLYHNPSLAEHIGNYSTLTEDECTPENGRMSSNFPGEDFDLGDWLSSIPIHRQPKIY